MLPSPSTHPASHQPARQRCMRLPVSLRRHLLTWRPTTRTKASSTPPVVPLGRTSPGGAVGMGRRRRARCYAGVRLGRGGPCQAAGPPIPAPLGTRWRAGRRQGGCAVLRCDEMPCAVRRARGSHCHRMRAGVRAPSRDVRGERSGGGARRDRPGRIQAAQDEWAPPGEEAVRRPSAEVPALRPIPEAKATPHAESGRGAGAQ